MASSSTSSVQKRFEYDVFLSFRGEDTRKTFVDHLYHALESISIITYKDDEKIEKGKRIDDQLIRSIEDSKFYIVVFSKNYASSSWCLDELVKIMECQRMTEHIAYIIFYDVEPTEIRKQNGSVGEAFSKFEKEESARKWRAALQEAAGLAGWELKTTANGHEAKLIQNIVQEISPKLLCNNLTMDKKLVGIEARVKEVVLSLHIGSNDVCMIGIKGMGGGGKTTLARAVFDQISNLFDGSSFVENVREVSKGSPKGTKSLQKRVLKDVLNDKKISVSSVPDGKNKMKSMLGGKKVLIVLDDVDCIDQLDALAGEPSWFKPGSKIIITTRDEHVLETHQVNLIHDVNLLSNEEAICLFSRYAFKKEIPIQGYLELSKRVVHYAAGLPLTLKVLGSFLYRKTEAEWIDALKRLKTIPLAQTLEILEISYNGLEDDYKEIFLDVACMLKGWNKEEAIGALESCGFNAKIGLRVLEQKSLITISHGYLDMHDHIEEMGKNIVRRLHPNEPHKHSRLWKGEEIEVILADDLGTEETKCIYLVYPKLDPATIMKGLKRMKGLRFLHVIGYQQKQSRLWRREEIDDLLNKDQGAEETRCIHLIDAKLHPSTIMKGLRKGQGLKFLHVQENREYKDGFFLHPEFYVYSRHLPDGLRLYVQWFDYPCWPKTFQADNIVPPQMCRSNIRKLWEGGERKVLDKVIYVDLSDYKLSTLNLGPTPNLETLILRHCDNLVELHMHSETPKLKFLDLSHSYQLRIIHLGRTPNLEVLLLTDCGDLEELHMPAGCGKLKSLDLFDHRKLKTLNLSQSLHLEKLNIRGCEDLAEVHMPVALKSLCLKYSRLRTLDLAQIHNIEEIIIEDCKDLVELIMPVESLDLRSLQLNLSNLRNLNLVRKPNLETLRIYKCVDLVEFHIHGETPKLKFIDLSGNIHLRIIHLGRTPNLEVLSLDNCHDLEELYMPVGSVKLKFLDLFHHSKLRTLNLWQTLNLEKLDILGCENLVELHMPAELKYLCLEYSRLRTLDLAHVQGLEEIVIIDCKDMVKLIMPVESLKLKTLQLSDPLFWSLDLVRIPNLEMLYLCRCEHLVELQLHALCSLRCLRELTLRGSFPEVPKDLHHLQCLEKLTLSTEKIKHLPNSMFMLKHLKVLKFKNWYLLEQLPEDLGRLECLEELSLSSKMIKYLPNGICTLKHLKVLKLKYCYLLERLPEDLGGLECLETLDLRNCIVLQDIPNSICEMKRLKKIQLSFCILVKKLPEELGRLKCLKELDIEGAGITHLPLSIFRLTGLCIHGSTWQFVSYGFTSFKEEKRYTAKWYI